MTYPFQFREHVFATKRKDNLTFEETAKRFNIPVRSLFRWQKKIEPCLKRNKPVTKINMQALEEDVKTYPDAYQWERAQCLKVAERTVSDALKRLGVSYKKTFTHLKANEEKRAAFKEKINQYQAEGKPLVYLDESGFAKSMPRRYGYAPKGQRCYELHDWQAKGRVNAIGAICNFSFLTVDLFEGNINADVFYAWVTNALLPSIPQNSVIIMDNACFHKRKDIIEAIENTSHMVEFLPAYSPELNPIEKNGLKPKLLENVIGATLKAYSHIIFKCDILYAVTIVGRSQKFSSMSQGNYTQ